MAVELSLSSNDVIDAISFDDRTVEIIGYVDVIELPKIVGKNKKYKLMKFVINNGEGRRVQCISWEEHLDRIAAAVQLNKIIYLDGVHAKKIENSNFNIGNAAFELIINSNSIINDLGDYDSTSNDEVAAVALADVGNATGKIKVTGFMKTLISLTEHKQGMSSYGIGAITDGSVKLEIRTTSINHMPPLEKGEPMEIVGTIHHDRVVYLQVTDGKSISAMPGMKMKVSEMINITKTPAKRARLDG